MAAELNVKMSGDVIISSKDLQDDQKKEGNHPSAASTDPNSCLKIFLNMGKTPLMRIMKHCSEGRFWSAQCWRFSRAIYAPHIRRDTVVPELTDGLE